MKLSIIIPVFNSEKYICRCLDSLLNQDLEVDDYEILIINDGSKDGSIYLAEQYEQKYTHVHIHHQENGGVGNARNNGIVLAKGEYIYFIDSDDYLASNILNLILNNSIKNELDVLTFLSTRTYNLDVKDSVLNKNQSFLINKTNGIAYIGDVGYKNEVWWYVIKKEFLTKSGIQFIEGRWMEDAIFTATLFLKVKAMAHLPIDVHRHVITPGSAMTSKEPSQYLRVIYDNANAAEVYKSLIESINNDNKINLPCIKRLKTRQQSFVFFMMVRMLKSTIKLKDIKSIMTKMLKVNAYPLNSFLGKDYSGFIYFILVKLFNIKYIYYLLFLICNPLFKLKNIISKD
jgi:glycosyltransferase involved in cell wall biosynthesis